MARVKSASVPCSSRSLAFETSTAACAIMPGRISPTAIVSTATATKMSSSIATSAVSRFGTWSTAIR